ncbi:hypothetical protein Tco_0779664, partial [Tanacetum coccineum]
EENEVLVDEAIMDQNGMEKGETDKEMKGMNAEKHKVMNEKKNKVDNSEKHKLGIIDTEEVEDCTKENSDVTEMMNEGFEDDLSNVSYSWHDEITLSQNLIT